MSHDQYIKEHVEEQSYYFDRLLKDHIHLSRFYDYILHRLILLQQDPSLLESGICLYLTRHLYTDRKPDGPSIVHYILKNVDFQFRKERPPISRLLNAFVSKHTAKMYEQGLIDLEQAASYVSPRGAWTNERQHLVKLLINEAHTKLIQGTEV